MIASSGDVSNYAGYVLGGGLGLGAVVTMLVSWFLNRRQSNAQANATEADASGKVGLIEALEARIAANESRQNAQDIRIQDLEGRIAVEIDLRLKGAVENHTLKMRMTEMENFIRELKRIIVAMGGTAPELPVGAQP